MFVSPQGHPWHFNQFFSKNQEFGEWTGGYPILPEPAQKSMRQAEISQLDAIHWQPFRFRCLSAITRISINSSKSLNVAETSRGWKVLERSVTTSCAGAFPGPLAKIGSIFFLNTFTKQLFLSWKDLTQNTPRGSQGLKASWLIGGRHPWSPDKSLLCPLPRPCPAQDWAVP